MANAIVERINSVVYATKMDVEMRRPDLEVRSSPVSLSSPDIEMRSLSVEVKSPTVSLCSRNLERKSQDVDLGCSRGEIFNSIVEATNFAVYATKADVEIDSSGVEMASHSKKWLRLL